MGATLPAMSRWVETSPQGVAWLGYFYGGNTGGAVIGSLLAGFYLLRVFDMATATYVAVALNLLVGGLALLIAGATPCKAGAGVRKVKPAAGSWAVYIAIALSGMTALASQVIWTRTLSLLFGATVYTFSLILAVFLFGIGIGSSLGSVMARGLDRPRLALGWVQMLLCGAIAWAAYTLALSLPFWPIDPSIATSPWYAFRSISPVPSGLCCRRPFSGARASARAGLGRHQGPDPGRLVGGVYAANTVGAIVGAIGGSLLMVTWLGTQHSQQALIILSGLAALLVLEPLQSNGERVSRARRGPDELRFCSARSSRRSWRATSRRFPSCLSPTAATPRPAPTRISTSSTWAKAGTLRLRSRGSPAGSSTTTTPARCRPRASRRTCACCACSPYDGTLIPKSPKKVLVIGCGAGVTAGAVSIDPYLEHETIAEIEPLVPKSRLSSPSITSASSPIRSGVQLDDARMA